MATSAVLASRKALDDLTLALRMQREEIREVHAEYESSPEEVKEGELDQVGMVLDTFEEELCGMDSLVAASELSLSHAVAVSLGRRFGEMQLQEQYDHIVSCQLAGQRVPAPAVPAQGPPTLLMEETKEAGVEETKGGGVEETKEADVGVNAILAECVVCSNHDLGCKLVCEHMYCFNCLYQLHQNAMEDVNFMPARCCKLEIDARITKYVLQGAELERFMACYMEATTLNKMYCPNPQCSTMFNLDLLDTEASSCFGCPKCGSSMCTKCKAIWHGEEPCDTAKSEVEKKQVMELGKEMGWKSCGRCGHLVQLSEGCHHMTCLCGHEFCYVCGRQWTGNCGCPLFDEQRLLHQAEGQVGPIRDRNVRQRAVARRVAELRHHDDCEHHWEKHDREGQMSYYALPRMQCDTCNMGVTIYGYLCRGPCRQVVCKRCRFNRMR
ncbi:unnamed protein product [Chrysoparadoxa australica]